jgi:hypothetical protein
LGLLSKAPNPHVINQSIIFKDQVVPEIFSDYLTAEDESTDILENVGNHPSNNTASHPTGFESLTTLL